MHKFAVSLATAVLGFTVAAYSEAVAAAPQAAARPQCVGCGDSDIEVHYLSPTTNITSGTETFDFGTTPVGTPIFFTNFAIGATQGYTDLLITSIDLPAGFTYVFGPNISPTVETAGASHATKIQCDAEAPGTYSGNLVINSDDPDEGTFTIALLCKVEGVDVTESTEGEENGSDTTGDGGSGAGLPDAGSSTMQVMLLGLGLLVLGGGSGLLARRRS